MASVLFAVYSFYRPRFRGQPTGPVKPKTPPAPLVVGSGGQLRGASYRIQSHAVVEIARVGSLHDRHEFHLADSEGGRALLICSVKSRGMDWALLKPCQPPAPMNPPQAAAQRVGDKVNLGGIPAPVTDLFLSTVRRMEGGELPGLTNGTVLYGFTAESGADLFLARWNAGGITFHRGAILPAAEVTGAFNPKAEK